MIHNDEEYRVTLDRISYFQKQVAHLRQVEKNPENYRQSVRGFLAELDRMNLEVREYLWSHSVEFTDSYRSVKYSEQSV